MVLFLRHHVAVAVLLVATAAGADEPLPVDLLPDELVPEGAVDAAVQKSGDRFFVMVRDALRPGPQAAARQERPMLRATRRRTGERGVLRPHALSSTRAETNSFLGVALFARRQQFTSSGGASVYGLEGGAAIRLLKQIDFTARYRMLSYEGSSMLAELQPEIGATLFGFAWKF